MHVFARYFILHLISLLVFYFISMIIMFARGLKIYWVYSAVESGWLSICSLGGLV